MEHDELVFHSRHEAEIARDVAFARRGAPEREDMQIELTPVLPEDPDNPGSLPCNETDPAWKGDYCVFGTDAEGMSWAVDNTNLEWTCIS